MSGTSSPQVPRDNHTAKMRQGKIVFLQFFLVIYTLFFFAGKTRMVVALYRR